MRMGPRPMTAQEVYWSHVLIVHEDGCWGWRGSRTNSGRGYGAIKAQQKKYMAHRVAYEIFNGPIPDNLWVLHKCDNPICSNPDHLWLGTCADNVGDMLQKGRHSPNGLRGSEIGSSKLTEDQIPLIRADARPCSWIAKEYGVTGNMISQIKRRKAWRHVP